MKDEQNGTAGEPLISSGRAANGRFAKGNPFAFPRGKSGHPGRVRSETMGKASRAQLRQIVPGKQQTYAEVIAASLAEAAIGGDVQAARELVDRAEGRARQSIDVQSEPPRTLREYAEQHGLEVQELIDETLQVIEEATRDDSGNRTCENPAGESEA